jgi:hypothetical protein
MKSVLNGLLNSQKKSVLIRNLIIKENETNGNLDEMGRRLLKRGRKRKNQLIFQIIH